MRAESDPQEAEAARAATAELQCGRPGYRALWRHFVNVSIEAMRCDFDLLGVHFDLWLGESDVQDRIPGLIERLLAEGFAVLSKGATVIELEASDRGEPMPPLILLKRDGAVMYGTTDLATIEQRIQDFQSELILYVGDGRQALHFSQGFQAARRTGVAGKAQLEHIKFGTVNGPDRKPLRTRGGQNIPLCQLLAEAIEQ